LWFREGIVEYLSDANIAARAAADVNSLNAALAQRNDEPRLRDAHRAAAAHVAFLVQRYGREQVLSWLRSGLPAAVPQR
jgi:hypothetical protein